MSTPAHIIIWTVAAVFAGAPILMFLACWEKATGRPFVRSVRVWRADRQLREAAAGQLEEPGRYAAPGGQDQTGALVDHATHDAITEATARAQQQPTAYMTGPRWQPPRRCPRERYGVPVPR